MRSFLLRLAGFLALQAAMAAPLLLRRPADDGFLAASVRKHERLERLSSPRVVLVGGSATAFGVDSPSIEGTLGIPVVNMGLYFPLGVEFMLREVEGKLRAGDVVVVSMEDALLFQEASPDALRQLVAANPRALRWLEPAEARRQIDRLHKRLGASLKGALRGEHAPASPPYSLGSFNDRGDIVAHEVMSARPVDRSPYPLGPRDHPALRKNLERLNRFHRSCESRGVRAFYSYPAVMKEALRPDFDALRRALEEDLKMPKLHGSVEMQFPAELFFDSKEHLTREGKGRRTQLLVRALQARVKP